MAKIGPREQQLRALRERAVSVSPKSGEIVKFEPQKARERQAKIKGLKEYATKVRDWDLLLDAVEQEISDIRDLVEWWTANVGVRHRPPGGKSVNADLRSQLTKDKAEAESGFKQQAISRYRTYLKDLVAFRDLLRGPSYRKAMLQRGSTDQKGASGTGENEWFTPTEYIVLARKVLGTIDLDPATSAEAQKTIKAKAYFTKTDNGLTREWPGRVWLNPPYAQPHIADFVSKLCAEYKAKRTTQAILLTHNYTDNAWFHEIAANATAICFTRGRVKFYEGDKVAAPTQGQAFSYFGSAVKKFASVFAGVGFVVVPWRK
jgi:phage N-6-adenine-methyltransferase